VLVAAASLGRRPRVRRSVEREAKGFELGLTTGSRIESGKAGSDARGWCTSTSCGAAESRFVATECGSRPTSARAALQLSWSDSRSSAFVGGVGFGVRDQNQLPLAHFVPVAGERSPALLARSLAIALSADVR
jgi:hypothetical protein